MANSMKGVKKVLDRWGCVEHFLYRGVRITFREFWDYITRSHSRWYLVDGKDGSFATLAAAKYYIDKNIKVG